MKTVSGYLQGTVQSAQTLLDVKREIPLLFFVNCERADLFFVKRDLYPPFTTLF